jgi:hypothetical protein
MKITLVDGSPSTAQNQQFTTDLAIELNKLGHQVFLFRIREKNIKYCNGCWTCWWKTPGMCVHHDDMPELYRSYLASDLVLHYSPLLMGFVSSLLKTVNDRSVPLVHPYGELVQGECHHRARYDTYPLMGLIVDPLDADAEDLQITKTLYERMALNLKTRLSYFSTSLRPMDDLVYEIGQQASNKQSSVSRHYSKEPVFQHP